MNILCMGDTHLRFTAPENRIDDFFRSQFTKMQEVFDLAVEYKCDTILQPGDLWDSPHPAKHVMSEYIRLFRKYSEAVRFLTVLGQHDMTMRNFGNVQKTASYLLESAGVIQIVGLDEKPVDIYDSRIFVHGLSFEQGYKPKPVPEATNILLAHAPVGNEPLYPAHRFDTPRGFIKKHSGFDLIVVGDYHFTSAWQEADKRSTILGAGCLVRKTVLERDREHRPCVFIYNTEDRSVEKIVLKSVKPWQEVFHIPDKVEENNRLNEFVEKLRQNRALTVSYVENLALYYRENEVSEPVKNILAEAMFEAGAPKEELRALK